MKKKGIVNNITKWVGDCKDNNNFGLYGFIVKLQANGLKNNNFGFILSLLETAAGGDASMKSNENVEKAHDILKLDKQISDYLYENLSKECKQEIYNVIEKGILNYNVCFNDCILFLCQSIDSEKFSTLMKNITKNCLSEKTKDVKKYTFFKNNLLHSNIWAVPYEAKTAETKETDDETTNVKKSNATLFREVENSVVVEELSKQQLFIKQEMCKLETEFGKEFSELKSGIKEYNFAIDNTISQNRLISMYSEVDYMNPNATNGDDGDDNDDDDDDQTGGDDNDDKKENGKKGKNKVKKASGIQPDYKLGEMPFDNVNGYVGTDEYDLNGYLTRLLIASHNINPIFQNECKKYFSKIEGCKYASAPVKTRERCMMKAKMDYNHKVCLNSVMVLISYQKQHFFYD